MKGFTLIELLIVLAILGIFLGIGVYAFRSCQQSPEDLNQTAADRCLSLGMNVQGVKCQKYDTDGDGYISCSISVKEINGNIKMVPLECAGPFSFNDGCRSPKPSVDYF